MNKPLNEIRKEYGLKTIFSQTKDGIETKIEYIGTMKLLDILINKIDNTNNFEDCKNYCLLYKFIYELLGEENEKG